MIRQKVVEELKLAGYDMLLPDEVAAIARVSIVTVYRCIRSGELKAAKVGGSLRIRRDVFTEWLDKYSPE